MFAVYASAGNMENPLTSLVVGERPRARSAGGLGTGQSYPCEPEPARHLYLDGRNRAGETHCFPDDSGE